MLRELLRFCVTITIPPSTPFTVPWLGLGLSAGVAGVHPSSWAARWVTQLSSSVLSVISMWIRLLAWQFTTFCMACVSRVGTWLIVSPPNGGPTILVMASFVVSVCKDRSVPLMSPDVLASMCVALISAVALALESEAYTHWHVWWDACLHLCRSLVGHDRLHDILYTEGTLSI